MSRQVEIQNLIIKNQRRLQKLKEKKAVLGINTPPEILTEIEDIETEIEHLNGDLRDLVQIVPSANDSQKSQDSSIKKKNKSLVEVLVAKTGLSGTVIAALIGLIGIGIIAYFSYLGAQTEIAPSDSQEIQETWLIIKRVDSYDFQNMVVQVTANVNGNEYVYPSSTDAQWLEVGPDMPPQRYRLPPAHNGYDVQFTLDGLSEGDELKMISQWVERVVELPFEGYYELYVFHPASGTRSGSISAGVVYEITDEIK